MEKIAFILQDHYIYWSSIFVLLGAGISVFTFLALYVRNREDLVSGFTAAGSLNATSASAEQQLSSITNARHRDRIFFMG